MPAFQFPDPLVQTTVTNPVTGSTYQWKADPGKWVMTKGASGRAPIFSDTEPTVHPDFTSPNDVLIAGDTWFDTTDTEQLIEYVYDGTQWITTGNYVKKKGGDTMQGPLTVTGNRTPNADGIESTVKTLNVDSGQSSTLNLKWDGATKVYIGETQSIFTHDIKFNVGGKAIYAEGTEKKGFVINNNGVFYDGNYTVDRHVATKKNVEEAIFNDILDQDNTNKYVDRTGDSMTGQLEMIGSRIVFNDIPADSQVIRVNRSAGENVDLLYLAHNGGSVLGYYDIRMTGNTSYNGIRFKGGSGGEEPIFEMKANGNYNIFYSDLRFDGNRILELGNAVDDTDAVPYGQIKQELQDKFNEYVDTISFGTYTYTVSNNPPQGYFAAYTTNGGQTEHTPSAIRQLWISKQNLAGEDIGLTSLSPGDIIRFADGADLYQFRVNGTPADQGTWLKIDVNKGTGPSDLTIDNSLDITLLKLTGGNINLDDYLKLDASNSPLTGNLQIKTGVDTAASLRLTGDRLTTGDSSATIAFENFKSYNVGYISYRAFGASQWFTFNQDVDLGNHGLHSVARIRMEPGGYIGSGSNSRLLFKNASSGNPGEGLLEVPRPSNNRRGFTIRGNDTSNNQTDILYSYTNTSGGDAVNYDGKMEGDSNIVNLKKVKELIAGDTSDGETFQRHGPFEYVSGGGTVSPGEFTTDTNKPKEVRVLTFNSKNQNGETDVWSDLALGEVITVGQGSGDAYLIVNYIVTAIQNYSTATIVDVDAHQTFVSYSDGSVVYNPNDAFNFLTDTPTYVLESQPATLNNAVDLSNKASPGPAFNSYILDTGTAEPLLGIGKGKMISMGTSNIQTPTRFMFNGNDYYGNGHKMGANSFDCPGSILELYRKNGDGTLCLCKVYEFSRVVGYGTNEKFEFRNLIEKHTATNNNVFFGSPGTLSPGAEYLVKYNINFTSTVYTIDAEGDPHYGDHRLEDIGHPVAATDAATKGYVDAQDELAVKKTGDIMSGNLQMGKVTADTPSNTNSPKITFEAKGASSSPYVTELYATTSEYLYSTRAFYANGTIDCANDGGFRLESSTRMGFGTKTVDNTAETKYGYLGIGTGSTVRAIEWSGAKGLQYLKANGTAGSQGQVLKKCRPGSNAESRPQWQGMVDIGTSSSNRSVGELWYNSNDQVLYLKVS